MDVAINYQLSVPNPNKLEINKLQAPNSKLQITSTKFQKSDHCDLSFDNCNLSFLKNMAGEPQGAARPAIKRTCEVKER
ncbi:Uncharacterized protein dnm_057810 [Desulfonema magnum]|uniref:Uncharacterized protein n=1 Tax=Desulfonema magnum TaxID=45655 RepID=A0A975BR73_9BACT|nr:Uncharacterized protein dnm_057810 [Desulfonema magnum]